MTVQSLGDDIGRAGQVSAAPGAASAVGAAGVEVAVQPGRGAGEIHAHGGGPAAGAAGGDA